jgi:hypothetical protein
VQATAVVEYVGSALFDLEKPDLVRPPSFAEINIAFAEINIAIDGMASQHSKHWMNQTAQVSMHYCVHIGILVSLTVMNGT